MLLIKNSCKWDETRNSIQIDIVVKKIDTDLSSIRAIHLNVRSLMCLTINIFQTQEHNTITKKEEERLNEYILLIIIFICVVVMLFDPYHILLTACFSILYDTYQFSQILLKNILLNISCDTNRRSTPAHTIKKIMQKTIKYILCISIQYQCGV